MTHWEYKSDEIYGNRYTVAGALNVEGRDGWEVVSLSFNEQHQTTLVFFKRPVSALVAAESAR